MPRQTVPDIDFNHFVLAAIPDLFKTNKICINTEYQRGDIWKHKQKVELIKSIVNRYSVGVLVLFVNDNQQYEILDGQQRLLTIQQYMEDKIDLNGTDLLKYSELDFQEKTLLNAYCVFYLKLKGHDPESKEEDIIQIFLRLQEGTPLNKAEKLNAHRGKFKDAFRSARETHQVFKLFGKEKRFRLRQLAAELLLLEMDGDFDNKIFPGLDLKTMEAAVDKYAKDINLKKLRFFIGNLDLMSQGLSYLLTGFQIREIITFYLLISYLRKKKANNVYLMDGVAVFAVDFLKNMNSFSIYDAKPPKCLTEMLFDKYKSYKLEAKIMTTPESIKKRFEFALEEYYRMLPYIEKDSKRLHDTEQKRILFFRQGGICRECNKPIDFRGSSADHLIAHADGGRTDDLNNAQLLHEKCHRRREKRKNIKLIE